MSDTSPVLPAFCRRVLFIASIAGCLAVFAQRANAEGREFSAQRHDLRLLFDSRWAGCRQGGNYPIRIRVTNTGPARNLTFRFSGHDRQVPTVERTVGLDQNATGQLTLPIPMTGNGNSGNLAIFSNGVELSGLNWHLSLPGATWNEAPRPGLVAISNANLDLSAFELAVGIRFTGHGGHGGGVHPSFTVGGQDSQLVSTTMLPDGWSDYSGLDFVSISLEALNALPTAKRTAMIDWVETGGTLLVTEVGGAPRDSEPLRRAIGLDARSGAKEWLDSEPGKAKAHVPGLPLAPELVPSEGEPDPEQDVRNALLAEGLSWPQSAEAFSIRPLLLGRVVAFRGNPFPGKPQDWMWLFASLPENSLLWTERMGISARRPHSEFLQFEIPGLRGVPVSAFLVLMTVFAVAIGPVNYYLLWRRKKLWMLVVSIPALAFGTSAALFAYSTISHGFGVKSRIRSVTMVDQDLKEAVSVARISMFAGVSPSRGLRFSPDTMVAPVWSGSAGSMQAGTVDWTEGQSYSSDWLRSRTRTQFLTVNHRTERGRLVVGTPVGDQLSVENGFAWPIDFLVVTDEAGNTFAGGPLPAGASISLKRSAGADTLKPLADELSRYPIRMPDGAHAISEMPDVYTYGIRAYDNISNVSFSTSLLEKRLQALQQIASGTGRLEPRRYVVTTSENPGIETGLDRVDERSPLHVIMGQY